MNPKSINLPHSEKNVYERGKEDANLTTAKYVVFFNLSCSIYLYFCSAFWEGVVSPAGWQGEYCSLCLCFRTMDIWFLSSIFTYWLRRDHPPEILLYCKSTVYNINAHSIYTTKSIQYFIGLQQFKNQTKDDNTIPFSFTNRGRILLESHLFNWKVSIFSAQKVYFSTRKVGF